MRVGLASKGEWHRLDEELRPLIKKTLYVPARASNEYIGRGAFKLLSSTDPEVRERAREELDRVVSRRLRLRTPRPTSRATRRATSGRLRPSCSLSGRRPARPPVAWELYDQGACITCGEATVSAGNRNKVIKILQAILNQGRDRSFQDEPFQGKAMACVAADLANSHFMRSGRYARFKEWRFIHRARLNLLPLNGTRTWVPAAAKRCRRCGYGEETLPHVLCHCMR
ncbi:hypothetical protein MTO96_029508 [Rhipicephalus appendiculatus]